MAQSKPDEAGAEDSDTADSRYAAETVEMVLEVIHGEYDDHYGDWCRFAADVGTYVRAQSIEVGRKFGNGKVHFAFVRYRHGVDRLAGDPYLTGNHLDVVVEWAYVVAGLGEEVDRNAL